MCPAAKEGDVLCLLEIAVSSFWYLFAPLQACTLQNDNSRMSWDICFHLCKYVGNFLPSPPGLLHTCFIRVLPWMINNWGLSLPLWCDQDNVSTPVVLQHTVGCAICAENEEDNRAKCYTEKTTFSVRKDRPLSLLGACKMLWCLVPDAEGKATSFSGYRLWRVCSLEAKVTIKSKKSL